MTEQIIIIGLAIVTAALVVIIILLLVRRVRGVLDPNAVFESVVKRLDDLARAQEKLGEIQGAFRAPQTRGFLGETMLEELLKSVLPRGSCRFQHRFSDGVRVDALVKVGPRYIPIDAKFPLESLKPLWDGSPTGNGLPAELKRLLSNLVADIAKKYIQPREHTFPFALMYIPSEAVFYEGFVRFHGTDDLFALALKKHVIPVSPSSLYVYLSTLMQGMRGYEFDRNADRIVRGVEQIIHDIAKLKGVFGSAQNHLKNLNRAFEDGARGLERLETSAGALSGTAGETGGETDNREGSPE